MAAFMPAWRPLDATHSLRLLADSPEGGRVVALCAAPGLGGTGEAARLAVALARRWVEGGLDVVLADGDLGKPSLHALLGAENGAGLADLVLAGGSWADVVRTTSVPGLSLIPAGRGEAASDPGSARERLAELGRQATAGGAMLGIFVPLGSMMAEWALDVASDIVVLALEHERPLTFFSFDEDRIRALVGPPAPDSGAPRPPAAVPRTRVAEAPPPPSATAAGSRPSSGGAQDRPPPAMDRGSAGIEERWAAAAALLRAQREAATGGEPTLAAPLLGERKPAPPVEEPELAPPLAGPPPPPPPAPTLEDLLGGEPGGGHADFPPLPEEYIPAPRGGRRTRRSGRVWSPGPPPDETWDVDQPEGGRRRRLVRALAAVVGVVVVAGAVWIWRGSRDLPPFEVRSTTLPRATTPARSAAPPAAGEVRPEGGQEAAPLPGEERPEPAPAAEPTSTGEATQDPDVTAAPEQPVQPPPTGQPAPAVGAVGRAPTPGVGEGRAPHQRFSWSVAAMGSYEAARALVERLGRGGEGGPFAIAPIVSDGRTLYRVVGGIAESRETLEGIREGVAAAAGVDAARLLVREVPLAFALQDFPDGVSAASRADQLLRAGVPAYVLAVARDDGTTVHRVYAGAYASAEEAAVLVRTLRAAGFGEARLVERRGRRN